MKILWISQNGGMYKNKDIKETGGWIGALQFELIKAKPSIELGIVFPHKQDTQILKDGNVTYFPFSYGYNESKIIRGICNLLQRKDKIEDVYIQNILSAVELFNPDIIHMWGLEQVHAVVLPLLDRPCIVHIQGLTSLYKYTYCTPFFCETDLKKCDNFFERVLAKHGQWSNYNDFLARADRELRYATYVKNWIGRTEWDYQASQQLSPGSNYFHCEEVLRNDFSNGKKWVFHFKNILHIQSNISAEWYKGIDVVLKTAELLTRQNCEFQWNVYGVDRTSKIVDYFSKKLKIKPEDVKVFFHGKVNGASIREMLLSCDVYMHPSYIENSSNAIAEAMMLGVPTIAQYVGGNPSMLPDDSGVLVAPNEPYILSYYLMEMRDPLIAEKYSRKSICVANARQNSSNTIKTLMDIYEKVISVN